MTRKKFHFVYGGPFVSETPPVISLEPPDNPATLPPRGSISVRCTATGTPPPTIMWIIGTNASDVIQGPILQLADLRKDETATCKAENNAGQVQEVLQILIAGVFFSHLFSTYVTDAYTHACSHTHMHTNSRK